MWRKIFGKTQARPVVASPGTVLVTGALEFRGERVNSMTVALGLLFVVLFSASAKFSCDLCLC